MTEQNARLLTANIVDLGVQLFDHRETVTAGLEIALRFNLKWIYDAFYVALADIVGCDMWTADAGLYRAVNPAFPNVHLLAELRRP
ncbi:MAG TPA: type II toxin-antitoxin system VapC family toxin [Dehalococcoidia bacterium]|nr:type II toxin-antitoxin system VapC family toxin [Dehalococcoidia bacterium]